MNPPEIEKTFESMPVNFAKFASVRDAFEAGFVKLGTARLEEAPELVDQIRAEHAEALRCLTTTKAFLLAAIKVNALIVETTEHLSAFNEKMRELAE